MSRLLITALVIALLVSSILSGCSFTKTKPSTKSSTTEVVQAQPLATPVPPSNITTRPPVRVWRDDSSSMNEDDLKTAVPEMLASIQKRSTMFSGIEVLRFARGDAPIWSERAKKFTWGDPPTIENFDDSNLAKAPVATKIFIGAKNNYVNNKRSESDRKNEGLLEEHYRRVAAQLESARSYLLQAPDDKAPCTKFTTLKRRMAQEDLPYNIVITDGWIDCASLAQLQDSPLVMNGKIVVLLLTRHADTQREEEAFERRASDMKKIFPTAKVIPVYLANAAIDELLN